MSEWFIRKSLILEIKMVISLIILLTLTSMAVSCAVKPACPGYY